MNAIKEKRLAHKMTIQQLADAIGVVPSTINGWESERYKPPMAMLSKIAVVFQCGENDAIWAVQTAPIRSQKELSAEELARREANKEKAQPYIERRLALGLKKRILLEKPGLPQIRSESLNRGEDGRAGILGKSCGRCWICQRKKITRWKNATPCFLNWKSLFTGLFGKI